MGKIVKSGSNICFYKASMIHPVQLTLLNISSGQICMWTDSPLLFDLHSCQSQSFRGNRSNTCQDSLANVSALDLVTFLAHIPQPSKCLLLLPIAHSCICVLLPTFCFLQIHVSSSCALPTVCISGPWLLWTLLETPCLSTSFSLPSLLTQHTAFPDLNHFRPSSEAPLQWTLTSVCCFLALSFEPHSLPVHPSGSSVSVYSLTHPLPSASLSLGVITPSLHFFALSSLGQSLCEVIMPAKQATFMLHWATHCFNYLSNRTFCATTA